ncbi:MAG: hypothetical protein HFJ84_11060 [Clostridiales bacterium]|nr:hypothetical protein [Clostridiales bacterium]
MNQLKNAQTQLLLYHTYSDEVFLTKQNMLSIRDSLNIVAYIQQENFFINRNLEISVEDLCKILHQYFNFEIFSQNSLSVHTFREIHYDDYYNNSYFPNIIYAIDLFYFFERCRMSEYPKEIQENQELRKQIQKSISQSLQNSFQNTGWI